MEVEATFNLFGTRICVTVNRNKLMWRGALELSLSTTDPHPFGINTAAAQERGRAVAVLFLSGVSLNEN